MPLLKNKENSMNQLLKFCTKNKLQTPLYEEVVENKLSFPPFTIKCTLAGFGETTAEACTKEQAKQEAAEKLLGNLKNILTSSKDEHANNTKTESELQKCQLKMLQHKEDHLVMKQMYSEIPASLKNLSNARKAANWDPIEKVEYIAKELCVEYNIETTQVQKHTSTLWYYTSLRMDTISSIQSWNEGSSKVESERKAAEDLLGKLLIMLTGYDNKMDMLYEVCESTSDVVPFSLYLVLKKLPRHEEKNPVYLFLCVLFVLMLESGFSPILKSKTLATEAKWVQQEKELKNIHYDVNRVYYYTSNFELFSFSLDAPFFWKFAINESMEITLIIGFISIGTDKLINIKVVLQGSQLGLGQCFKLSEFVPNPEATHFAGKFCNLRELSMKFKTMMWLARGEAFYIRGHYDKTAFDALPPHIHEHIASYLTK